MLGEYIFILQNRDSCTIRELPCVVSSAFASREFPPPPYSPDLAPCDSW